MPRYSVLLPITGYAVVEVTAETKDQAIAVAMENVERKDIEEWETHQSICTGNIFHGQVNDCSVEEVSEEE